MWAEFEWENKVAVNTAITEPLAFLDHIIASTNMVRCAAEEELHCAGPAAAGSVCMCCSRCTGPHLRHHLTLFTSSHPLPAHCAAVPDAALRAGGRLRLPGGQPVCTQVGWGRGTGPAICHSRDSG